MNAILQYTWHKLLSIYGNSEQTVVGTTVSGRSIPIDDVEVSVGLYINTLPLIVNHKKYREENKSIIESIREVQNNINDINARSGANLARLQVGGKRLFDSLFVYENYPNLITKDMIETVKINFKDGVEKLDYPLSILAYDCLLYTSDAADE